jgi:hypothetical protein
MWIHTACFDLIAPFARIWPKHGESEGIRPRL